MIDIINKRCAFSGCSTHPVFNMVGKSTGLYCNVHKFDGMVDVVSKRCQHGSCNIHASFAKPGNKPCVCFSHSTAGMICHPTKRCCKISCKLIALMGSCAGHAEFCELHSPPNYISLINEKCKGCNLLDIIDHEGYCKTCHPDSIQRYKMAKQQKVIQWLSISPNTKDFSSVDTVLPETIECKSRKYRPDIVYRMKEGYTIIVEVDENQHNTESYRNCDVPRMINIHSDLMCPTYIIRYNPDEYTVNKKKQKQSDTTRKKILMEWIAWTKAYGSQGRVRDGLHVLYLFYNDYDSRASWKVIDPSDKTTW